MSSQRGIAEQSTPGYPLRSSATSDFKNATQNATPKTLIFCLPPENILPNTRVSCFGTNSPHSSRMPGCLSFVGRNSQELRQKKFLKAAIAANLLCP
jgi:hypothetical protein